MKTQVKLHVGGCAGSFIPQSRRMFRTENEIIDRPVSRQVFGTHTTSFALLIGRTGILYDNGTGVAQSAEFLKAHGVDVVYIIQSHSHHDHVNGLVTNPFLLFDARLVKGIYGPTLNGHTFESVVDYYYAAPFWPISPKKLGINLPFVAFDPGDDIHVLGGVRTLNLNHADGAVAFRVKTPAGDVVFASDNELANDDICKKTADFIEGATLAYMDVQYTDQEYEGKDNIGPGNTTISRRNWGHSTPSMLQRTLEQVVTAPEMVLVGHHDPKRSDEGLFEFEKEIQIQVGHLGSRIKFARECQTIDLHVKAPPVLVHAV